MGLFFLKLILFIFIYILLLYAAHLGISRWLGVTKRKIFDYGIVNEKHKELDKVIRLITVAVLITGFILSLLTDFELNHWYIHPYTILVVSLISGELLKIYMEWKYIEDKREYTYTILETSLQAVLLILFFTLGVQYLSNSF
ncbi:DUF4181 domain-containing protein [Rossellomorea aquimaris]|uniref:DUF4181 domain-containing protein n=1 Tax=Rossellomorea aquimaris TaxID=189382 RepID=A0A1J6WKU4_9BACI|nr:DUF4181 domain-containing protein [Rossellomorea aquimaris]OIU68599.1 hypothetical protein BHE18_16885 [Rossellomorea aquimaris]